MGSPEHRETQNLLNLLLASYTSFIVLPDFTQLLLITYGPVANRSASPTVSLHLVVGTRPVEPASPTVESSSLLCRLPMPIGVEGLEALQQIVIRQSAYKTRP